MNERTIECYLFRHGRTESNQTKQYAGRRTDEELSPEGISRLRQLRANGRYPEDPGLVFSSPMKRCVQTAGIVTECPDIRILAGLEEIDFGRFEGHTWQELSDDADYRAWIESGGTLPFPGGESRGEFIRRTMAAFREGIRRTADSGGTVLSMFCHGGSIMAILSTLTEGDYWSFPTECGGGYRLCLQVTGDKIDVLSYYSIPSGADPGSMDR